jgi:D-aminoacyl-tRNA deacylase
MRVVVQRVAQASVTVADTVTGSIDRGLLVLCAFRADDTRAELEWMARKLVELRIFSDREGKMNLGLLETGGEVLVVSQFTLYGDVRKGRRPSFVTSAPGEVAERLYDEFVRCLQATGVRIATGIFAADMKVESINDGPVTLILDRDRDTEEGSA